MFNCQICLKMQIHHKITKYNYTNSNYYKTSSKNNDSTCCFCIVLL